MYGTTHIYVALVARGQSLPINRKLTALLQSEEGERLLRPEMNTEIDVSEGDFVSKPCEPLRVIIPITKNLEVLVTGICLRPGGIESKIRGVIEAVVRPGIVVGEKHIYRMGRDDTLGQTFDSQPIFMVHTDRPIGPCSVYIKLVQEDTGYGPLRSIAIDTAQLLTACFRLHQSGVIRRLGPPTEPERHDDLFSRIMHVDAAGPRVRDQVAVRRQLAEMLEIDCRRGPTQRIAKMFLNDDYMTGGRQWVHLHEGTPPRGGQRCLPSEIWEPFNEGPPEGGYFIHEPVVTPMDGWTHGQMDKLGQHIDRELILSAQKRAYLPKRAPNRPLKQLAAMSVARRLITQGPRCLCRKHLGKKLNPASGWRKVLWSALNGAALLERVRASKSETYGLDFDLRLEFGLGLGQVLGLLSCLWSSCPDWGDNSDPIRSEGCGYNQSDYEAWLQNLRWGA